MFKQITREEYLALADAGVRVSAWHNANHFDECRTNVKYADDPKHFTNVIEEVRDGNSYWSVFYAWVDGDEEESHVQPIA